MTEIVPLVPCLWFDDQAEAFAEFATGLFPASRITHISRYPDGMENPSNKPPGSVLTVEFELSGRPFTALNGGPHLHLTDAFSIQVMCKDQAEIDHYWEALVAEGGVHSQCGWLRDRFGVSWQVVPRDWVDMVKGDDSVAYARAFAALLEMQKLDVAAIRAAYEGTE